jgi:hypothetical protein
MTSKLKQESIIQVTNSDSLEYLLFLVVLIIFLSAILFIMFILPPVKRQIVYKDLMGLPIRTETLKTSR